jgi:hypothetical protein
MPESAVSVAIGGKAQVFCVHNREKRRVTELAFDPAATSLHLCSCCENLFMERSDTPMFCFDCRKASTIFDLGGPLPDPHGRV